MCHLKDTIYKCTHIKDILDNDTKRKIEVKKASQGDGKRSTKNGNLKMDIFAK